MSPTPPSPSAGSPWRLGVQRGEYLGHNPLRSKSTYSAVLQCEPQMLCTQKVGPVCPSDHREAGPGEGYATAWPAREGVLASLSTQSSFQFTKPLLKARILPAHLCTPLGWAFGVRRNSDPKMDQTPLTPPASTGLQVQAASSPGRRGFLRARQPEIGAARYPGVEVGGGLLMASRFPSSKASLLGPSSFRAQVRAPAGPPLDLPFPTPTTYTCTQECTHTGPPAGPHTVIHINTVTHLDTNTEMPAATRVPTRAQGHPIGTHTHAHADFPVLRVTY